MSENEKPEAGEQKQQEEQQEVRSVSVQDILGQYPIDREKARDVLTVEISASLIKVASSLQAIQQSMVVLNSHLETMNALNKQK